MPLLSETLYSTRLPALPDFTSHCFLFCSWRRSKSCCRHFVIFDQRRDFPEESSQYRGQPPPRLWRQERADAAVVFSRVFSSAHQLSRQGAHHWLRPLLLFIEYLPSPSQSAATILFLKTWACLIYTFSLSFSSSFTFQTGKFTSSYTYLQLK